MFGFTFQKCFEKNLIFFLLFSLLQINIFVFFLILFLNILRLGLAAQAHLRRIY
jgi:hypothetical protein